MKITIDINDEQITALKEWKPLLKNAIEDFEDRLFPEGHDFSYSAPEIIEEQDFLSSRLKFMKKLVKIIDKMLKECNVETSK